MSHKISVNKYDASDYSIMLSSVNVSFEVSEEGDFAVFELLDVDDEKASWLKHLADDMYMGIISVKMPAPENYTWFMNVLDDHNVKIVGTKFTWLFGHQYVVKGFQWDLSKFKKALKNS